MEINVTSVNPVKSYLFGEKESKVRLQGTVMHYKDMHACEHKRHRECSRYHVGEVWAELQRFWLPEPLPLPHYDCQTSP